MHYAPIKGRYVVQVRMLCNLRRPCLRAREQRGSDAGWDDFDELDEQHIEAAARGCACPIARPPPLRRAVCACLGIAVSFAVQGSERAPRRRRPLSSAAAPAAPVRAGWASRWRTTACSTTSRSCPSGSATSPSSAARPFVRSPRHAAPRPAPPLSRACVWADRRAVAGAAGPRSGTHGQPRLRRLPAGPRQSQSGPACPTTPTASLHSVPPTICFNPPKQPRAPRRAALQGLTARSPRPQLCRAERCLVFLLDNKTGEFRSPVAGGVALGPDAGVPGAVRRAGGTLMLPSREDIARALASGAPHASDTYEARCPPALPTLPALPAVH